MKRNCYLIAVMACLLFTACSGNKAKVEEKEVEEPSVSVTEVERQLVTFQEVDAIMKELEANYWRMNENKVKKVFGAKGYDVIVDDVFWGYVYCTKNCEIKRNEDVPADYSFSPINDSIASSVCFFPMGDMYVMPVITFFDDDVYKIILDQAKSCGFAIPQADELAKKSEYLEIDEGEKGKDIYCKGKWYFVADESSNRIKIKYLYNMLDS